MAWVGFTVGLCLFVLAWSSVVKTLLDLPSAIWSGSRARLGAVAAMPQRPANREPGLS